MFAYGFTIGATTQARERFTEIHNDGKTAGNTFTQGRENQPES